MRKISFFWKTWFTTMAILLLSIIVCVVSFVLVTQYVSNIRKTKRSEELGQNIEEVSRHIEEYGIDDEYYWTFLSAGYAIEIKQNNEIVFPVLTSKATEDSSLATTEPGVVRGESGSGVIVSFFTVAEEHGEGESSTVEPPAFSKTNNIKFKGEEAVLTIFDVTIGYQNQMSFSQLQEIIPYYIIGGLIVAMVGSYFYARFFNKKMERLNVLVEKMGASEVIEIQHPKEGDELQLLENNLYLMYQKLQDTMTELDEEVIYTKKLEADKQLFMRGATHELKTPIMAASVMLEGMIEKLGDYENTDVYLRKCYQTLQSMNVLVNEILEVSKIEHVQFTGKTRVTPIIKEMLEMYQPEILDKELHVITILKNDKDIKMSEKAFRKVISNLIGNAIKYSDVQSEIAIQVTDKKITVQNQMADKNEIQVETLFEPFKSGITNDEVNGHGLGLYIVSSLLERYNIEYNCYIEQEQQIFVFEIMV